MEQPFCLPEAFESFRIADRILGDGYESTPAQLRAWIKTTLALAQSVWPECPARTTQSDIWSERGFGRTARSVPAPWVLAVLGPDFAAAPRLAAALMCARLAGAHNIVAVWSAAPESLPPQLAATLELTGVEHTLALGAQHCRTLTDELRRSAGRGRVLSFPGGGPCFACFKAAPGLPGWQDISRPVLGVLQGASIDAHVLRWAHPDAEIHPVPAGEATTCIDALYTDASPGTLCDAPLLLHAGLEGCWLPANLDPYFFRNICTEAFAAPPSATDPHTLT